MSTYGINTQHNGYIDVSATERGAKAYATIHGYKDVYRRGNGSYHIEHVAHKHNGKWSAV